MLWRYEERDGRKTKPPLNPNTGLRGDVTDPIHWTDYETALSSHQLGRYRSNGISVVVHPDFNALYARSYSPRMLWKEAMEIGRAHV